MKKSSEMISDQPLAIASSKIKEKRLFDFNVFKVYNHISDFGTLKFIF